MKGFTLDDIRNSPCGPLNAHLWEQVPAKAAKSKYGARKAFVDNITFDSQREANRYIQLRHALAGGHISELELQVAYELNAGGTHSLKYIADFRYRDGVTGELVVEDAKGFKTREYRKKRRLMLEVYGIKIKET